MNAQTRTVRTVDVRLAAGRQTLRLILNRDENGDPEALSLALGYGGGGGPDPFTRPAWGEPVLQLPADAMESLRDALAALQEAEP
jgi:hypothetical protein